MAVYKATYCYPLLNGLDIRVTADASTEQPCEWLTCKINSSNKNITGYKIRILDSANNQVFPNPIAYVDGGYISEVSSLQWILPVEERGGDLNSGRNGTILKIPFFQNFDSDQMKSASLNAVYYVPRFKADYFFTGSSPIPPAQIIDNDSFSVSVQLNPFPRDLRVGDTVLFPANITGAEAGTMCDKGIFQVTNINSLHRIVTFTFSRVAGADSETLAEHSVVITKGENHDKVFYFDENLVPTEVEDHSGLWVDIEGNPIDLNIDGGSYKWEITLYQGEYEEDFIETPRGEYVYYADYSNLSMDWFDTVLNSGKILGSTNKRIHIASTLDDDAVLPLGTLNSPIVLQGTYAQLFDANKNPLGNRAYVQTYDSSYGHVYPINGGFSKEIIDSAVKICFYKHSNNAEDVLANERVDFATTPDDGPSHNGNIPIYIEVGGRWEGNPNLGLIDIDEVRVKEGDYVLVKNQTRQCENGVYLVHENAAWTRSASYKNWGNFIGAVLFVANGVTNGGTNWESTATAGGTLFDTSVTSGASPLMFLPEKPILLFTDKIDDTVDLIRENTPYEDIDPQVPDEVISHDGNTYTIRLYTRKRDISYSRPEKALADGVSYSPGQRIFCYGSRTIIEVVEVTGPFLTQDLDAIMAIKYNVVGTADVGDYLDVLNGEEYGGEVVQVENGAVPTKLNESVRKAFVLKNGTTYTYVSPYIGLKKDMALKLLNNQKVTYADDSVSQWIKIQSPINSALKSINTTVWRIGHKQLAEPLLSDSSSDPNIPFTYEVRTYYRASDENSFFLCEKPYVVISGLDIYGSISRRFIELHADYHQFQQASWESYRWALFDENDNLVQDTGTKYDRQIHTFFYGLSNDEEFTPYKVVLYVVDDMKNELSAELNFVVGQGQPATSASFLAEFDCSTHSMILSFSEEDIPTGGYAIYRREYQKYERKGHTAGGAVIDETKTYVGSWEPVQLQAKQTPFRDFNIKAGHSYQYVLYEAEDSANRNQFANATDIGPYSGTAVPIVPHWDEWSLIELKPVENVVDAPILRKTYEVDLDNIWFFKYSLETGNQTQNIQKSEVQTLGQFQKIGYGRMNYISGDVSCMLGSEIVPYSKNGYVERMRRSAGTASFSSNEKAFMLEQWRKIASSPNPKLLRDIKGQSWIVQIMSSSNSPKNFYYDQPDTISFSWKQIDTTDGVVIVGDGTELPKVGCFDSIWKKVL